jgi:ribonuclease HI
VAVHTYHLLMTAVNNEQDPKHDNRYVVGALTNGVMILPFIGRTHEEVRGEVYALLAQMGDQYLIHTRHEPSLRAEHPENVAVAPGTLPHDQNRYVRAVLRGIGADIMVAHPPVAEEEAEPVVEELPNKLMVSAKNARKAAVEVYTDASAPANNTKKSRGVYGWVQKVNKSSDVTFQFAPASADTDTLEIRAIADAISEHLTARNLVIYSDSQNAIAVFNRYARMEFRDVTAELEKKYQVDEKVAYRVMQSILRKQVELVWVKSHQDNTWNVCADQMVRYARARMRSTSETVAIAAEVKQLLTNLINNR